MLRPRIVRFCSTVASGVGKSVTVAQCLKSESLKNQPVTVNGWVKTVRSNRFLTLNDGSTVRNLQCVVDKIENINHVNTGTSVRVWGSLVPSLGKQQDVEVQAAGLEVLGEADGQSFPIQPKKHTLEFLRDKAHLRIRTTTFASVMKVRSALSFAIHQYFNSSGYVHVHTPIITQVDAEGAGEVFAVSNNQGFFGRPAHLTVSGQLHGETYALALSKIYTFGPTFRAENSNTSRHLAEFWMVEPEIAFCDLPELMVEVEQFMKYLVKYVLDTCDEELEILGQRQLAEDKTKPLRQRHSKTLKEQLQDVVNTEFVKVTYDEAFKILQESKHNVKGKFRFKLSKWGVGLSSEHERYLVEHHFKAPVIVYNYPEKIKAFYMRENKDKKTVAAMDLLFPGIGEIVGGSQREERLDRLERRMQLARIPKESLEWYLDTRRFGTVVHSGFGLGFERLVMFATGMTNVRDTIPFPRTPASSGF